MMKVENNNIENINNLKINLMRRNSELIKYGIDLKRGIITLNNILNISNSQIPESFNLLINTGNSDVISKEINRLDMLRIEYEREFDYNSKLINSFENIYNHFDETESNTNKLHNGNNSPDEYQTFVFDMMYSGLKHLMAEKKSADEKNHNNDCDKCKLENKLNELIYTIINSVNNSINTKLDKTKKIDIREVSKDIYDLVQDITNNFDIGKDGLSNLLEEFTKLDKFNSKDEVINHIYNEIINNLLGTKMNNTPGEIKLIIVV